MSVGDPNYDRWLSWKMEKERRQERIESGKPYLPMFILFCGGIALHRYWNRILPIVKKIRLD